MHLKFEEIICKIALCVKDMCLITICYNTGCTIIDSLCWDSKIHGHYVYKDIWTPFVEEILCMKQETNSAKDHFTILIVKAKAIVGHIPHKFKPVFQYH